MNKSSQLIQKVLSPWVLFMVLAIIVFSFFYVDKPLVECLSTFHLHQRFPILEILKFISCYILSRPCFFDI